MFKVAPGDLYLQLGALIATMPDLAGLRGQDAIPLETEMWLADVYACVSASGEIIEASRIQVNAMNLLEYDVSQAIRTALFRAYAVTRLKAPAQTVSSFVAVGNQLDAFKMMTKVLGEARASMFIIDPYTDHSLLTDFLLLANEGVAIRVLTCDVPKWLATLQPAAIKWVQQYAATRPLEVRSVATTLLHDRDIILDRAIGYAVSQSFKDIAKRSPATILPTDAETAAMKIAAYEAMWAGATVIV